MASYEKDFSTSTPDVLFAGTEIPALTTKVTIASGQGKLPIGSVIGIVTSGGKGKLCDKTANDGSQTAKYILAEAIDATSADVAALVYKTGFFNPAALTIATGDDVWDHVNELRDVDIHLRENYGA